MKQFLKKADIVLLIFLIAAGLIFTCFAVRGEEGKRAVVTVDGTIYGEYDLAHDQDVTIRQNGHYNQFIIRDGSVQMIDADCANRDCIRQGAVRTTSRSIICLPNKVSITIEGGTGDVDVVAG